MMDRRAFIGTRAGGLLAARLAAEAQPAAEVYGVGVVLQGGPYHAAVDGLRDGLKELGFEEGTQYVLHLRDLKGDLTAVGEAARNLERKKVDLIHTVATGSACRCSERRRRSRSCSTRGLIRSRSVS
jgi:ABC-type uncharacterized transport system substrate-binding protein